MDRDMNSDIQFRNHPTFGVIPAYKGFIEEIPESLIPEFIEYLKNPLIVYEIFPGEPPKILALSILTARKKVDGLVSDEIRVVDIFTGRGTNFYINISSFLNEQGGFGNNITYIPKGRYWDYGYDLSQEAIEPEELFEPELKILNAKLSSD